MDPFLGEGIGTLGRPPQSLFPGQKGSGSPLYGRSSKGIQISPITGPGRYGTRLYTIGTLLG